MNTANRRVEKRLTLAEAKARRLKGQLRQIALKKCRHPGWDRIPYIGGAGHYLRCSKCKVVKKAWGQYEGGPRKRSESAEPQLDPAV